MTAEDPAAWTAESDPRVRMLGGLARDEADDRSVQLLEALDDVEVRVLVGHDVDDAHLPALLVLLGLCMRIFGTVSVDRPVSVPQNWWGLDTAEQMLAAVRQIRPRSGPTPTRALVITFGTTADGTGRADDRIGIGGSDWVAALSEGPIPCRPSTHGLGLHTAVCLAVAQLLGRTLARAGYGAAPAPMDPHGYALDLLTHRPLPDPDPLRWPDPGPPDPAARARAGRPIALGGVGSVGTSTAALLATSLSPALAVAAPCPELEVTCVDADTIDPDRNPFRYPALTGAETGSKSVLIARRLTRSGLRAYGQVSGIAAWVTGRTEPGFPGTLVSSVDTVDGRLEVADTLAAETLSIGVAGLALHVQREHLGDEYACPFCDFISADPPTTQAQVYSELTGLPVERVLQLLDRHDVLAADDVAAAVTAGRLPAAGAQAVIGERLEDLLRRAYAEAAINPVPTGAAEDPTASGTGLAVAAPHVSWIAGALAVAEIVKDLDGLPRLDRRVDLDLAGLPPGAVRRRPADPTGRCVCRGALRPRWMRNLHT